MQGIWSASYGGTKEMPLESHITYITPKESPLIVTLLDEVTCTQWLISCPYIQH